MIHFDDARLSSRPPSAFAERRQVRFQDVDAAGLVFYPRVLEWFHDVYVAFLAAAGTPLPEVLAAKAWAAPLSHAEARYKKPLRFGDDVEIALVCAHVEATEATLGYRLARIDDGTVAAIGQSSHVFVDPATFRRRPVPEPLRDALARLGTP